MPVDEPLYPVNLRLRGVPCLVVGGGDIAAGKVLGLVEAEGSVTVVAPSTSARLDAIEGIAVHRRAYEPGEVAGYRLAVTATGRPDVDALVSADAQAAGVWVNSADDPDHCTFTLPSRLRHGDLLVTFATGGRSPAFASWLRERFDSELGPEYDTLLDILAEARSERIAQGQPTEHPGWKRALDSGMLELIREGNLAEAKERLQACLSSSSG
jgi:siroheme synthase-like protein